MQIYKIMSIIKYRVYIKDIATKNVIRNNDKSTIILLRQIKNAQIR